MNKALAFQYAPSVEVSPGVWYCEEQNLWWKDGTVYCEESASPNGIIGYGLNFRETLGNVGDGKSRPNFLSLACAELEAEGMYDRTPNREDRIPLIRQRYELLKEKSQWTQ
ncbi:MAG: hypothetical protein DRQ89_12550 [Epsilonproteobacteria bacterium]|nr:MAG: hypothetical protein DRQ89_12550 [Campylobacterota bacterium]